LSGPRSRHREERLGRRFEPDYCSEYSPWLPGFIRALAERLEAGMILFADYGYERRDYYHPERSTGTLVCHSRHRAHDDPFHAPGLEDVSAWVDFEAVAEAGLAAGLEVRYFRTQTQFLLENGLLEALAGAQAESAREVDRLRLAQEAERLLLPGDMGTKFKVLALGRPQG
jgi:SAM-dependent MidA family methyltransferase